MVFGNNGELYIQIGGNTNSGIAGPLSTTSKQEEDLFSAATIVAENLKDTNFDGMITYDDDGNQLSGFDVRLFASGQRNSYGIMLHSNGNLYATDNGPNNQFGDISVSCTEEGKAIPGPDKLNHIMDGHYYGHANRLRGQNDARQCKWRDFEESSDDEYTAPIAKLRSSSNGLCEFATEHFDGQLRGSLLIGRYKGDVYNIKLKDNGLATEIGKSDYPPTFIDDNGTLDIVQGPDGTLFTVTYKFNKVKYHKPTEESSLHLKVKSTFPRRGPKDGGSTLTIYGDHLYTYGVPSVLVGGNLCSLQAMPSESMIRCTLPAGEGVADIVVSAGLHSHLFIGGYRYINAEPQPPTSLIPALAPIPASVPIPTLSPTSLPSTLGTIEPSLTAINTTTVDSLGVLELVWVNTVTNMDIGKVTSRCEACFDLSIPVSLRADTFGDVNSVLMQLEGPLTFSNLENNMPFTLFRDVNNEYRGKIFKPGVYTISVQAFSAPGGNGLASEPFSIDFEIASA